MRAGPRGYLIDEEGGRRKWITPKTFNEKWMIEYAPSPKTIRNRRIVLKPIPNLKNKPWKTVPSPKKNRNRKILLKPNQDWICSPYVIEIFTMGPTFKFCPIPKTAAFGDWIYRGHKYRWDAKKKRLIKTKLIKQNPK